MIAAAIVMLLLSILLLLWPFVVYPAILGRLQERPVMRPMRGEALPSATLVFCAYNEAASLPDKIANLRALKARHPALEILAYNDGSADGTAALLDAAADILTPVHGPGRAGKARGMKTLAARARGDVIIFTDANVTLAEDAVARLLAYYADPLIGGVLGSLVYDGEGASSSAQVGGLYWRIEEGLKDRESRSGNVMGADGSIFSIRRELYPDFPDSVLDDLVVSMSVVFAGRRLIKAKDVVAREMMVGKREDEMRRKVRIAARAWHTHRYLRPQLRRMAGIDRFKYASRKIVRWFGALWMATGGIAALVLLWQWHPLGAVGIFLFGCGLLSMGYGKRTGMLASLTDIVLAYGATMRGIMLAARGRDFTLWQPAKSRMDAPRMENLPVGKGPEA
ncbi:glycosyltransferase [Sphingobium sufflavum]|uniref:glycosyltransferase n=1 Tax=Sphingobium sufflavum TaxID=1129547 RepID=UPI001F2092EC|nr:glycosyltransferase [Sphingobium sufflavum]MCE7797299.1 glycosyltransferase [Sphingobium sufflavum]